VACFGRPGAKITGTYVLLESFGRLLERPNREGISAFAAGSPVRECRILRRGHRCGVRIPGLPAAPRPRPSYAGMTFYSLERRLNQPLGWGHHTAFPKNETMSSGCPMGTTIHSDFKFRPGPSYLARLLTGHCSSTRGMGISAAVGGCGRLRPAAVGGCRLRLSP
jgi:hypothetical protein